MGLRARRGGPVFGVGVSVKHSDPSADALGMCVQGLSSGSPFGGPEAGLWVVIQRGVSCPVFSGSASSVEREAAFPSDKWVGLSFFSSFPVVTGLCWGISVSGGGSDIPG